MESKKPCIVSKKCNEDADPKSFFQRIGKYVILFVSLGIVAVLLTMLTVSIAVNFGGSLPLGAGVYWDFNVFFTYMIGFGFIITPIVILYVSEQRKKMT